MIATIFAAAVAAAHPTGVEMRDYGTTRDGQHVGEYVLRNHHGMTVHFIALGGIITAIHVPDRAGHTKTMSSSACPISRPTSGATTATDSAR